VEGKGKLPDYLQCGHYPLCIVSDRVIEVWDAAKITGYESSPVKLIDAQKEEINQGLQYHNITVTNTVELDFEKMGVEIVNTCDVCGGNDYNKPVWEFGKAVLKDEHLIEFDLFVCRFFKMSIHCSVKMLEEVYKNKLTNFKFYEYEARFLLSTPVPDIDLNKLFSKRKNSLPDTAK
jgi:hypothetical protein